MTSAIDDSCSSSPDDAAGLHALAEGFLAREYPPPTGAPERDGGAARDRATRNLARVLTTLIEGHVVSRNREDLTPFEQFALTHLRRRDEIGGERRLLIEAVRLGARLGDAADALAGRGSDHASLRQAPVTDLDE